MTFREDSPGTTISSRSSLDSRIIIDRKEIMDIIVPFFFDYSCLLLKVD